MGHLPSAVGIQNFDTYPPIQPRARASPPARKHVCSLLVAGNSERASSESFRQTRKLCATVSHNAGGANLSSVRDARAARTANALRRALLELLEHKAWDEITVRDITSMADISYATFFRHYSTKEALLNEVASDQMRSLV